MKYGTLRKRIGIVLAAVMLATNAFAGFAAFGSAVYAVAASVSSIQADETKISYKGGTVNLTVSGEGLTSDNWGVEIEEYISGTSQDASNYPKAPKITVDKLSSTGAVISVSANGMNNDFDVIVRAGIKDENGKIDKQAETKLLIGSKGYRTKEISPKSAELISSNIVKVSFNGNIEAVSEDELNKNISFKTQDGKNYALTSEDIISASEDGIVITLGKALTECLGCSDTAYMSVVIEEHSYKLAGDTTSEFNSKVEWHVVSKPNITKITFDNDVLDYKGGDVTATLSGFAVSQIKLSDISAEIYEAGAKKASSIETKKAKLADGTPTVSFKLPANNGETTKSYSLIVKVDGTPVYLVSSENRGELAVVSVMAKGVGKDTPTVSAISITGNNAEIIDGGIEATVLSSIGSLKTEIRIYGTALNDTNTKLRITDENGIEWPIYAIPECDATWRFLALSGMRGNGIFGNGNSQLVELLPARCAGTNKTYTIEVAPDGKNFDENSKVILKINNEGIQNENYFRDCSSNNFKYVTVNYVDENGNKVAASETFKGYEISMTEQFVKAKEIDGYTLVKEPTLPEWLGEGGEYTYVYKDNEPIVAPAADPKHNDIPAYQKKNVFEKETNAVSGIKVVGKYNEGMEFTFFNTTTQEVDVVVKAKNGTLPTVNLKKNHNYIIYAQDNKYEAKAYVWNKDGVLKNIKDITNSNVRQEWWKYSDVKSIEVVERDPYKSSDNDRYTARIQVYIGESGPAINKKFKLVSEFDTVEATTKSDGMLTASLLEDVAYTVILEDEVYGIQSFPLVVKDKSEYNTKRYTYDHTTCHFVGINPTSNNQEAPIRLISKSHAHDEDTSVVSITGDTKVSGFKFNDCIVKESKLDTKVDSLTDNYYDVIDIKLINPHRWEVTKLCAGDFTISEKYDNSRTVKNVYQLNKDGSLEKLDFSIKGGRVEFKTTSLSLYPVVIEYNEACSRQVYGASRYETAIKAADELKATTKVESFDNIIVAYGGDYPDALAGSYLAKVKNAPIVLVSNSNEGDIKKYIESNLKSGGTVYILGGKGVVSGRFEDSLKPLKVERLGGINRYETNIAILKAANVTEEDLLICTGAGYADSLSASAVGKPILLVGDSLTAGQRAYLKSLKSKKIYAIGGSAVVSDATMNAVCGELGIERSSVERAGGKNRFETSVNIAKTFFGENSINNAVIASAANFPDGLAGGPVAIAMNAPLLLVTDANHSDAKNYCRSANVKTLVTLGGTAVISEGTWKSMLG